jgi:AcrR family transcriptional regulator
MFRGGQEVAVRVREAKKQQTRRMLSEVATGLFAARGFDQVTVAEIAAAAGVSKMTVFNYFPRKEDLLFDRQEEAQRLLEEAVHGRQPGEQPVAALRRLALALLAQRHPLSGLRDGSEWFWKIVEASPTLVSRMREVREELELALAHALAEASSAPTVGPDDSDALRHALLAASVVAVFGLVHRAAQRRLRAGETSEAIYPDLVARVNLLFDQIERGLHGAAG